MTFFCVVQWTANWHLPHSANLAYACLPADSGSSRQRTTNSFSNYGLVALS